MRKNNKTLNMITQSSISNGILNAKISCRLEQVVKKSIMEIMPEKSVLYIDGAHNKHGAKAIAAFLKSENEKDKIPNYIINGRTKDSDLEGFLEEFLYHVKAVMAVRVEMEGKPESPYKIAKSAESIGLKSFVCSNILDAIEKIVKFENNIDQDENFDRKLHLKPVRIVICGSFYLARDLAKIK